MRSAFLAAPAPAAADTGPIEPAADELEAEVEVSPEPPSADEASPETLHAVSSDEIVDVPDLATASAGPPIEVICFGAPRVLCAGQQVWPRAGGGEAKPWEMLLYLACQPVKGANREDAVLALWPDDSGASEPTHRIRQLRYRLRGVFNKVPGGPRDEGICLERNGALFLDQLIIHSDAQEFLELIRLARLLPGPASLERLERAHALYTADLLQGPDVRRYAWADERDDSGVTLREHFRRLFQHATLSLAEIYTAAGNVSGAMYLYRELSDLDPGDERIWCALFRLHASRSDGPALMREHQRMRAGLRELAQREGDEPLTISSEPSRETQQEYQRLVASLNLPEHATSVG
jgi:DNA-binding SARP family transcriptional activator